MYKLVFKRVMDIVIAGIILLLTSPLMLLVCIINYFSLGGSPFFFQGRPGRDKKIIRIIKFKTMRDLKDSSGKLLPDAKRITPFGAFIRKLSIDELPQMINVLKGDMSLIGPRPLLVSYLPLYNEFQARRQEAKPGITGWAQVNGRNAISWQQKFELDVWYVDHVSFLLDVRIFFLTIKKVLIREGISSAEHATMPAFKGNNPTAEKHN